MARAQVLPAASKEGYTNVAGGPVGTRPELGQALDEITQSPSLACTGSRCRLDYRGLEVSATTLVETGLSSDVSRNGRGLSASGAFFAVI
jgi:hypothetical protein